MVVSIGLIFLYNGLLMLLRSLALQFASVLAAGLIAWQQAGLADALSVLYGAFAALINTGLLVWRFKQGERDYHCDAQRHLKSFYRSSLERYAVVGAWLAIGFGVLNLAGLPLVLGFVIGQLAWVLAALLFR